MLWSEAGSMWVSALKSCSWDLEVCFCPCCCSGEWSNSSVRKSKWTFFCSPQVSSDKGGSQIKLQRAEKPDVRYWRGGCQWGDAGHACKTGHEWSTCHTRETGNAREEKLRVNAGIKHWNVWNSFWKCYVVKYVKAISKVENASVLCENSSFNFRFLYASLQRLHVITELIVN